MQCYKQIAIIQNGKGHLVPCGKCNFCLQNRRHDWSFRLEQEMKVSKTAHFLTPTYDNNHIPMTWEDDMPTGVTLDKKHLFTFHESIKKSQKRLLKKEYKDWKIRYYSVGEYGSKTGRPHYHSIMFNIHPETLNKVLDGMIWTKGHVYTGTVTPSSIAYVTKYLIDKKHIFTDELPEGYQLPFNSMSRNPGIGANYMKNRDWHRAINEYDPDTFRIYAMNNGKKVRLPRYYKDKIFKECEEWYKDVLTSSLETHYQDLADKFEQEYISKIEELTLQHEGDEFAAIEHYNSERKTKHDLIRIKSLKLNTL